MFRKTFVITAILMVFTLMFASASFTLAQQGTQQMQPIEPQKQNPEIKIDDKMLNRFISTAKEVDIIKAEYSKKMQGLKDNAKAMELQQKAQQDINSVLKKHGFDPQTYNSIGNAIMQNPELMDKLKKELIK